MIGRRILNEEENGNYLFCKRNAEKIIFKISEFNKKYKNIEIRTEYKEKINEFEFKAKYLPYACKSFSTKLTNRKLIVIEVEDGFWAELNRGDEIYFSDNTIRIYSKHRNINKYKTMIYLREKKEN